LRERLPVLVAPDYADANIVTKAASPPVEVCCVDSLSVGRYSTDGERNGEEGIRMRGHYSIRLS
jgi:hypothetical protein